MAITLDSALVDRLVGEALAEDRASDDATTSALLPPGQRGRGTIVAKAPGVIAGLAFARSSFHQMDPAVDWQPSRTDGDSVSSGATVAVLDGSAGAMLRAERTALNFLAHLSGVATAAAAIVALLEGTGCRLRDTRKTIPGLRLAEKYAAQAGGAETFRADLADAVMIKDNHLAVIRAREVGIQDAVRLVREADPGLRIEVEVTSIDEAREAIEAGAGELLLDNMTPAKVRPIVELAAGLDPRPLLEASGGITAVNARQYAEAGVDFISIGAITHSAPALDLSLGIEAR
ncbi:MAG TPA: carboxylating nicotinate-nucleotide diphosphorylase [Dehalococcoidia bacterium]